MFKRLKREVIYESPWVNLLVDSVSYPDGHIIERQHIVDMLDAAVGLVFNQQQQILFVKPYRYILNDITWELPAGMIEQGELPITAFTREVQEETNIMVDNVKELRSFYTSNGVSNQQVFAFTACCQDASKATHELAELAELAWFDVKTVKAMIQQQEIQCGITLNALLYYFFQENEKESR